jgi:hypothetical protein
MNQHPQIEAHACTVCQNMLLDFSSDDISSKGSQVLEMIRQRWPGTKDSEIPWWLLSLERGQKSAKQQHGVRPRVTQRIKRWWHKSVSKAHTVNKDADSTLVSSPYLSNLEQRAQQEELGHRVLFPISAQTLQDNAKHGCKLCYSIDEKIQQVPDPNGDFFSRFILVAEKVYQDLIIFGLLRIQLFAGIYTLKVESLVEFSVFRLPGT